MEILLAFVMLCISNKYIYTDWVDSFFLDVLIQCLHIFVFILITIVLINSNNLFIRIFSLFQIYIDYYKIKELILDIHYEFFEGEKETEEDNKKER